MPHQPPNPLACPDCGATEGAEDNGATTRHALTLLCPCGFQWNPAEIEVPSEPDPRLEAYLETLRSRRNAYLADMRTRHARL